MKVVQIAESFAYGTARSVKQLVGILKQEHAVTVFYGDRDGTALEQGELDADVDWVKLPGTSGPLRHWTNYKFLKENISRDVQIVHGHSSFGGAYAKALGRSLPNSRTLYSPRGYAFLREDHSWISRKAFWAFERATSSFCETVACGPSELRYAKAMCPPKAFHIGNGWKIPHSVNVDGIGSGVVIVGRISIQKGFDKFLEIARRLPHVNFDWIGSAEVGQEDMCKDVPANVNIIGYMPHPDVLEKIQACRFVLLPSRWEGLSRFLVESVCYGKAIVTSECDANVDCLDAAENGFKNGFRCQSLDDYVTAIETLLHDDELVRRMQRASSEYAKRSFDIDKISRQWLDFYSRDLKACDTPSRDDGRSATPPVPPMLKEHIALPEESVG